MRAKTVRVDGVPRYTATIEGNVIDRFTVRVRRTLDGRETTVLHNGHIDTRDLALQMAKTAAEVDRMRVETATREVIDL